MRKQKREFEKAHEEITVIVNRVMPKVFFDQAICDWDEETKKLISIASNAWINKAWIS